MGQGYKDHLITPEDAIPNVDKVQWKKICETPRKSNFSTKGKIIILVKKKMRNFLYLG